MVCYIHWFKVLYLFDEDNMIRVSSQFDMLWNSVSNLYLCLHSKLVILQFFFVFVCFWYHGNPSSQSNCSFFSNIYEYIYIYIYIYMCVCVCVCVCMCWIEFLDGILCYYLDPLEYLHLLEELTSFLFNIRKPYLYLEVHTFLLKFLILRNICVFKHKIMISWIFSVSLVMSHVHL